MYFVKISIHALREESDLMSVPALIANVPFQSTLSVRRATTPVGEPQYRPQFQSTLSVRRATRAVPGRVLGATFQSTLSVRRATNSRTIHPAHRTISIHALREESDVLFSSCSASAFAFQSTLSVRRATLSPELANSPIIFQSTLSVRRATIR